MKGTINMLEERLEQKFNIIENLADRPLDYDIKIDECYKVVIMDCLGFCRCYVDYGYTLSLVYDYVNDKRDDAYIRNDYELYEAWNRILDDVVVLMI